jgi:hypothetical protein
VSCAAATSCTAVGESASGAAVVVEGWDGTQWRPQSAQNVPSVYRGEAATSVRSVTKFWVRVAAGVPYRCACRVAGG